MKDKILNKAKVQLISNGCVFYSTILFNLKQIWTDDIPTAATDGIKLLINPDWFCALTQPKQLGLLIHEVSHVALDTNGRSKGYDPKIFNIAADYVINLQITDEGYEIPDGGLLDTRFRGMSTEEVYHLICEEVFINYDYDVIEGDDKQINQQIQEILIKAITASKLAKESIGNISSEAERLLEERLNPILPWETLLQNYVDTFINEDYSWRKPNRRYSDIILPSLYSEGIDSIVFCNDASGSVSDEDFNKGLTEFRSVREKLNPRETTIIAFDTEIKNICVLQRDEEIPNISYIGYGGTSLEKVRDYIKENPPTLAIIFSDGDFEEVSWLGIVTPILYIIVDNPDFRCYTGDVIHYNRG